MFHSFCNIWYTLCIGDALLCNLCLKLYLQSQSLATWSWPAVTSQSPARDQARLVTAPACPTSRHPAVTRVSVSTGFPLLAVTWAAGSSCTECRAPDTATVRPRPGLKLTSDLALSSHSLRQAASWPGGGGGGWGAGASSRMLELRPDLVRGADSVQRTITMYK